MSHKGSWNRTHDHQAARDAWERIWGAKEPPRANTDAKALSSSDHPKPNERADATLAAPNNSQHDGLGEANDNQ